MKFVYYVVEKLACNEEEILNSVTAVCTTEILANHAVENSIDHIKEAKNNLGFGECISEYSYRDGAGIEHLILTYGNDKKLTYEWKIRGIVLTES